jgi:hypothetical protein
MAHALMNDPTDNTFLGYGSNTVQYNIAFATFPTFVPRCTDVS